jgi:hypothetical protein
MLLILLPITFILSSIKMTIDPMAMSLII